MKILLDIGHPAHVHYFKNFIRIMKGKGHRFLITARDKEMTHLLMKRYGLPFKSRGRGANRALGKLAYMFKANALLYRLARNFLPDLFVSFGSPYCDQVAFLCGKPHICFGDTEHASFSTVLHKQLSTAIVTSTSFRKDFGEKHVKYNGFIELSYLHPVHFTPDSTILPILGVPDGDRYAIVRFVAWNASHDFRHRGFSLANKRALVKSLLPQMKVFISSEDRLPDDLRQHELRIPAECIHDALAFASLFVGESGTMSTEAALLGTPAINVSTSALEIGTFQEIAKYGLMYVIPDNQQAITKAVEITAAHDHKSVSREQCKRLLSDHIDVTEFMVWFVSKFPESKRMLPARFTMRQPSTMEEDVVDRSAPRMG